MRLYIYLLISLIYSQQAHEIADKTGRVTTVLIRDASGGLFSAPTSNNDDFGRPLPEQKDSVCTSLSAQTCGFLEGTIPVLKKSPAPLTQLWLKSLKVGDKIDALDYTNHWFTGVVSEIKDEGVPPKKTYKIHFDEWEEKWDEWLAWDSGRLQEHLTHAKGGKTVGGVAGVKYYADELPATEFDPIPPKKTRKTTVPRKPKKAGTQAASKDKTDKTKKSDKTTDKKTWRNARKKTKTSTKKEKEFVTPELGHFLNSLSIGQQIDCLDSFGYWYTARVIKVDKDRLFVKFDDWEDKWNEWVPRFSGRFAKHKSIAKGGQHAGGVKKPKRAVYK